MPQALQKIEILKLMKESSWVCVLLPLFSLATPLLGADSMSRKDLTLRNQSAVQTIYREGVPHTDKNGRVMLAYEKDVSFFPIGLWGPPVPDSYEKHSWDLLAKLKYNTVWPWPLTPAKECLDAGAVYGLQVIIMGPIAPEVLSDIKGSKNLLGNVWEDEPIGKLSDKTVDMTKLYNEFLAYRKMAAEVAPDLAVFINDAPWITEPATAWWKRWNTAGTVSCHDNYPITATRDDPPGLSRSIAMDPKGIPQSVGLAVSINNQKKPVWFILGAFDGKPAKHDPFPFRYASPMQLRSQAYTAIISGATGIHYFTLDDYVSRDAGIVGMAPSPQVSYPPSNKSPATPMQLVMARALWDAAGRINEEIDSLAPVILSPTVGPEVDYGVEISGVSISKVPIRCILKRAENGDFILITANSDNAVLSAEYSFPFGLEDVEKLYENSGEIMVSAGDKKFSVHYEPFAVHVLRIVAAENK